MENDPVIHGLLRRQSEIAGCIGHLEAQVSSLRSDLLHVDAALRIVGYAGEDSALPVRKACTSGLFHRKELTRLVTAILRANTDGLQASEIAITIARDKGWSTDEKPFQVPRAVKVEDSGPHRVRGLRDRLSVAHDPSVTGGEHGRHR